MATEEQSARDAVIQRALARMDAFVGAAQTEAPAGGMAAPVSPETGPEVSASDRIRQRALARRAAYYETDYVDDPGAQPAQNRLPVNAPQLSPERQNVNKGLNRDGSEKRSGFMEVLDYVGGSAAVGVGQVANTAGWAVDKIADIDEGVALVRPIGDMLSSIGKMVGTRGEALKANVDDETRAALEGFAPDGDILKPSTWTLGEDATFGGMALTMAGVMGQMAPIIVGAIFGGTAGGAIAGAAQVSDSMQDQTRSMMEEAFAKNDGFATPYYLELIQKGVPEHSAKRQTIDRAADMSAVAGLALGAASGGFVGKLTTGNLASIAGQRLVTRVGQGAALGAGEEAGQELAESIGAGLIAQNQSGDASMDVMAGTFGDALLGLLSGGSLGGVGGIASPGVEKTIGAGEAMTAAAKAALGEMQGPQPLGEMQGPKGMQGPQPLGPMQGPPAPDGPMVLRPDQRVAAIPEEQSDDVELRAEADAAAFAPETFEVAPTFVNGNYEGDQRVSPAGVPDSRTLASKEDAERSLAATEAKQTSFNKMLRRARAAVQTGYAPAVRQLFEPSALPESDEVAVDKIKNTVNQYFRARQAAAFTAAQEANSTDRRQMLEDRAQTLGTYATAAADLVADSGVTLTPEARASALLTMLRDAAGSDGIQAIAEAKDVTGLLTAIRAATEGFTRAPLVTEGDGAGGYELGIPTEETTARESVVMSSGEQMRRSNQARGSTTSRVPDLTSADLRRIREEAEAAGVVLTPEQEAAYEKKLKSKKEEETTGLQMFVGGSRIDAAGNRVPATNSGNAKLKASSAAVRAVNERAADERSARIAEYAEDVDPTQSGRQLNAKRLKEKALRARQERPGRNLPDPEEAIAAEKAREAKKEAAEAKAIESEMRKASGIKLEDRARYRAKRTDRQTGKTVTTRFGRARKMLDDLFKLEDGDVGPFSDFISAVLFAASNLKSFRPKGAVNVDASFIYMKDAEGKTTTLAEVMGRDIIKVSGARPKLKTKDNDPQYAQKNKGKAFQPRERFAPIKRLADSSPVYHPDQVEMAYPTAGFGAQEVVFEPYQMDMAVNLAAKIPGVTDPAALAEWAIVDAKTRRTRYKTPGRSGTTGAARRRMEKARMNQMFIELAKPSPADDALLPPGVIDVAKPDSTDPMADVAVDLDEDTEGAPREAVDIEITEEQRAALMAIFGPDIPKDANGIEVAYRSLRKEIDTLKAELAQLEVDLPEFIRQAEEDVKLIPVTESYARIIKTEINHETLNGYHKPLRVNEGLMIRSVIRGDKVTGFGVRSAFREGETKEQTVTRVLVESLKSRPPAMRRELASLEARLEEINAVKGVYSPKKRAAAKPKTSDPAVADDIDVPPIPTVTNSPSAIDWSFDKTPPTEIVDRFGHSSPPLPQMSDATSDLIDRARAKGTELQLAQVEGIIRMAAAHDARSELVGNDVEEMESNLLRSGFLLMDGTGLGKTMQLLGYLHHVVTKEFETSDLNRRALVVVPGASAQQANSLVAQWYRDAQSLGIADELFTSNGTFREDRIRFSTYTMLKDVPGSGEVFSTIIMDEVHERAKNTSGNEGSVFSEIKAPFRVFSTATPTDKSSQASYYLRYMHSDAKKLGAPKKGESPIKHAERRANELVTPLFGSNPTPAAQQIFNDEIEAELSSAAQAGLVMSRQLVGNTRFRMEEMDVSSTDVDQEAVAAYKQAKNASDKDFLLEHIKLPGVIRRAVDDIMSGRQAIVVFQHSTDNKKVPGKFRRAAIKVFEDEMDKALAKAGLPRGRVGMYYGTDTSRTTIGNFQSGFYKALAITDAQGSTGIDLDDQTGMSPRTMYIIKTAVQGEKLVQLFGRVDRQKTKTIPEIVYMGIKRGAAGIERDADFRDMVRPKLTLQDTVVGKVSAVKQGKKVSRNPELSANPLFRQQIPRVDVTARPQGERQVLLALHRTGVTPGNVLDAIIKHSEPGLARLARRLKALRLPDEVYVDTKVSYDGEIEQAYEGAQGVMIPLSQRRYRILLDGNQDNVPDYAETFLHEYIHVLTAQMLVRDTKLYGAVQALMATIPLEVQKRYPNAFTKPEEFVAELFSVVEFQNTLKALPYKKGSWWDNFLNWLGVKLGIRPAVPRSVFERTVQLTRLDAMTWDADLVAGFAKDFLPEAFFRPAAPKSFQDASTALAAAVGKGRFADSKRSAYRGLLAVKTLTQIVKDAASIAETGEPETGNVLERMKAVIEEREASNTRNNQRYKERALDPVHKWARGEGKRMLTVDLPDGPQRMSKLALLGVLTNATGYAGVHFGKPVDDKVNSKLGKYVGAKGKLLKPDPVAVVYWDNYYKLFAADGDKGLGQEGRDLYNHLAEFFEDQRDRSTRVIAGTYLDALYPEEPGGWINKTLKEQKAKLAAMKLMKPEDLKALGATKDQLNELGDVLKVGRVPGAYFPLRRYGNLVVTIKHEHSYTSVEERERLLRKYPGARYVTSPPDTKGEKPDENVGTVKFKSVSRFENEVDGQRFREEAMKDSPPDSVSEVMLANETVWKDQNARISSGLINRLEKRLDEQEMDKKQRDALLQQFTLAMLDMTPETSMAAALRKRAGVEGASIDITRTLHNYGQANSRYLASLQFSKPVREALKNLKAFAVAQQAKPETSKEGQKLIMISTEIDKRLSNTSGSNALGGLARTANDVGFFYYLLGPSYNILNATQTIMLGYPELMSRHGSVKSLDAMKRAYGVVGGPAMEKLVKTGGTITALRDIFTKDGFDSRHFEVAADVFKNLKDPNHKRLMQHMLDNNMIDVSLAMDMRSQGERKHVDRDGKPVGQGYWSYLTDWMRMAPHTVEVMNRTVMALSSFDLEYAKQLKAGKPEPEAFAIAQKYSIDVVETTQFIYADWNKPRILQNDAAKVVFMFMQHVQHMYYYMISNAMKSIGVNAKTKEDRVQARKALAGFVGMHVAAAGVVGGTPEPVKFLMFLGFVAAGTLGLKDDDDPWNWELLVANTMSDMLGDYAGSVATKGLPSVFGMDLSGRIGMDSMLMFNGPDVSDKDNWLASIVRIVGGPMSALVLERFAYDVPNALYEGRPLKALEAATPKVMRDFLKTTTVARHGFTDYYGRQFSSGEQLGWFDYGQMYLGFTPSDTTDAYMARSVLQDDRKMQAAKSAFYAQAFRALKSGDGLGPVMVEIARWNRRNPAYRIEAKTLMQSLRENLRIEAESQRGVTVPDNKRSYVNDRLRFNPNV